MKQISDIKIGVLGGGQLGKMLFQEATKLDLDITFLEKDDQFPASKICNSFVKGDFKNYDDVMAFGKEMDVITIEIEAVNTDALLELEKMGKKVYPQAHLIEMIKDKGEQKLFFKKNGFKSADFILLNDKNDIMSAIKDGLINYPFVQKARKDGYDGKAVALIHSEDDLHLLMDTPSVIENKVDIKKELSVIVARNSKGSIRCFPTVEMDFHPQANLVEYLYSPSRINEDIESNAIRLAIALVSKMEMIGIMAIELFLDTDDVLWINEIAPRPHNSGHQTIEANSISQYGQLLRVLTDMPLGATDIICPSVMINLIGDKEYNGKVIYQGLDKVLATDGVHVHIYGKHITKPYRKMGHITVLNNDLDKAIELAHTIKQTLKVIA